MSSRKENISYRDVVGSIGVRVGDQVTFRIPGSDRADIGVVKGIKHDDKEMPLYVKIHIVMRALDL